MHEKQTSTYTHGVYTHVHMHIVYILIHEQFAFSFSKFHERKNRQQWRRYQTYGREQREINGNKRKQGKEQQ